MSTTYRALEARPSTFDELLEACGGCGRYQIRLLLIIGALCGTSGALGLSFYFIGRAVPLRCAAIACAAATDLCLTRRSGVGPNGLHLRPRPALNGRRSELGGTSQILLSPRGLDIIRTLRTSPLF